MRCDCGAFESCDVCIALAERDLGPYTAEDYARKHTIEAEPPDELDALYTDGVLHVVQEFVHEMMTKITHSERHS